LQFHHPIQIRAIKPQIGTKILHGNTQRQTFECGFVLETKVKRQAIGDLALNRLVDIFDRGAKRHAICQQLRIRKCHTRKPRREYLARAFGRLLGRHNNIAHRKHAGANPHRNIIPQTCGNRKIVHIHICDIIQI